MGHRIWRVLACSLALTGAARAGSFNTLELAAAPDVLVTGAERYSGVGRLGYAVDGGVAGLCTGSLVAADVVLTAGHCLGGVAPGLRFYAPGSGDGERTVTGYAVATGAAGVLLGGGDLMLLRLDRPVEAGLDIYGVYRGESELGRTFEKVGFGQLGTGRDGVVAEADGGKRVIRNRFEATLDTVADAAIAIDAAAADYFVEFTDGAGALTYDFDSGLPINDLFGRFLGLDDLGVGDLESISAPGDSGGPSFIVVDGVPLIAGVTSFAFDGGVVELEDFFGILKRPSCGSDRADRSCNPSSWGDVGGDARVSPFADWIDLALAGGVAFLPIDVAPPPPPVPAPPALALLGLGALWLARRR